MIGSSTLQQCVVWMVFLVNVLLKTSATPSGNNLRTNVPGCTSGLRVSDHHGPFSHVEIFGDGWTGAVEVNATVGFFISPKVSHCAFSHRQ